MDFITKVKGFIDKNINFGSDILKIDTLIGKRTSIEGNFNAVGNCKIDGSINGEVKINGDLIVGEDAFIDGDISAVNIVVAGKITGNITANGQLSVKKTADVRGEHSAYSLIADEGADFVGACRILGKNNNDGANE